MEILHYILHYTHKKQRSYFNFDLLMAIGTFPQDVSNVVPDGDRKMAETCSEN
jgi:hypothetical protein